MRMIFKRQRLALYILMRSLCVGGWNAIDIHDLIQDVRVTKKHLNRPDSTAAYCIKLKHQWI